MSTDLKSETTMPEPDNTTSHAETVEPMPSGEESNQQFQRILEKVYGVLANLPAYVTEFFSEYKRPLVTIGVIALAYVSVKLLLAILIAINELPLLAPTFELIGLGATGWFVYRFLYTDAKRQELSENISAWKDQVLGKHK